MPQSLVRPSGLPISVLELRDHVRQDVANDDVLLTAYLRAAVTTAETICGRSLVAQRWKLVLDSFPGGAGLTGVAYGKVAGLPRHAILLERGPVLAVQSIKYLDYSGVQQTLSPTVYTADLSSLLGRVTPRFGQIWPPALPQIGSVEITYDGGDCALVTADVTADTITIVGGIWKPLAIGDAVRFTVSGSGTAPVAALPAPLRADTDYFVKTLPTATSMTLAATLGGALIDITDTGQGQSYIGACHESVRSWLLCRVGALFENREDATIIQRGALVQVPYLDRLLDPATNYLN